MVVVFRVFLLRLLALLPFPVRVVLSQLLELVVQAQVVVGQRLVQGQLAELQVLVLVLVVPQAQVLVLVELLVLVLVLVELRVLVLVLVEPQVLVLVLAEPQVLVLVLAELLGLVQLP